LLAFFVVLNPLPCDDLKKRKKKKMLAEKVLKDDCLLILFAESYWPTFSLYTGISELPFLPLNTQVI
jgi:hypothetical protein